MTLAARIRRLSVAFHERTILHDITLDIPAEGITVLLGRSGSGKTTFLRALNRLNECLPGCRTSGEARTPVRRRTPPDLCRTHGRGRTL